MGGVFNTVNANLYHYAGNNPVKYTDPDGNSLFGVITGIGCYIGAGAVLIAGTFVVAPGTIALAGELSFADTAKKMGESAFIAAISSGLTEGIIANGLKVVGRYDNLLTGTLSEFNIIQPKWAGSVGNIGENVLPTVWDVHNSLTGDE